MSAEIEELKEFVRPISPENAIGRISRIEAIQNKSIAMVSKSIALAMVTE